MSLPPKVSTCNACDSTFTHSSLLPSPEDSKRLLQILRTNCPHSVGEASDIHTFLEAVPNELERYDAELKRLFKIVKKVLVGRKALEQVRAQCETIVDAPIRRLPTEILAEIFAFCQQPKEWNTEPIPEELWEEETKRELARVAGGHLVSCSQVCTQWREVITGTSSLWSIINLDLRCWDTPGVDATRKTQRSDTMIKLLKVALERGQETRRNIQMHGGESECQDAVDIVARTAPFWRYATLALGAGTLKHLTKVKGRVPLLKGLSITQIEENHDTLLQVASCFSDAPLLCELALQGSFFAAAHLPLEQLTSCIYMGHDATALASLLSQIPRLTSTRDLRVKLNYVALRAAMPLVLPAAVSPAIERLDIGSLDDEADASLHVLGEMLGALTLPSMQELNFAGTTDNLPMYWPYLEAHDFLVRSGSRDTLKFLDLCGVVICEYDLLQCLAVLTSLVVLEISDYASLEAVLGTPPHHLITEYLLRKITTSDLVPKLRSIYLRTLGAFTDDTLRRFIVTRSADCNFRNPFECDVAWLPGYSRELNAETAPDLDDLVKKGTVLFWCEDYEPNERVN
ncbi:hypothetical protein B0H11DRAFT_2324770 [Mycena galericulata]|nr:hypothetical protein B0H11DRAFT_2324770 [Mycena galericulata]